MTLKGTIMKQKLASKLLSFPKIKTILVFCLFASIAPIASATQSVATINAGISIVQALINLTAVLATLGGMVVLGVIMYQKYKSERDVENFGTKLIIGAGLTLLGGGYLTSTVISDSGLTAAAPTATTFS